MEADFVSDFAAKYYWKIKGDAQKTTQKLHEINTVVFLLQE